MTRSFSIGVAFILAFFSSITQENHRKVSTAFGGAPGVAPAPSDEMERL